MSALVRRDRDDRPDAALAQVVADRAGGIRLEAFAAKRERLLSREARTLLAIAPTPAEAARLTRGRLRNAVTRAGRQRRIEAETDRLLEVFRRTWLRQPALVEQAMGRQTLALLAQLDAACQACDDLASDTEELFLQHPDAEIITSFPGLALLTGARILAEIGDDRSRSPRLAI